MKISSVFGAIAKLLRGEGAADENLFAKAIGINEYIVDHPFRDMVTKVPLRSIFHKNNHAVYYEDGRPIAFSVTPRSGFGKEIISILPHEEPRIRERLEAVRDRRRSATRQAKAVMEYMETDEEVQSKIREHGSVSIVFVHPSNK